MAMDASHLEVRLHSRLPDCGFANLAGGAVLSAGVALTPAFPADVHQSFLHIGHAAMSPDFATTLARGVFAGFLIAVMIWLLPGAGAGRLWIVVLVTYVVGLGSFSHIIAGSSECFYMIFRSEKTSADYVLGYFAPALLGNAVGGVVFVAALAHAQHGPEGASDAHVPTVPEASREAPR
jgi:formate/nitrite transporter FocA (FNT family)